MKRIVCIILVLILLCTMISCDSKSNPTQNEVTAKKVSTTNVVTTNVVTTNIVTTTDANNIKEKEFEVAKAVYADLLEAEKSCTLIMDTIYGAWYHCVYDKVASSYEEELSAFCIRTGLKKELVASMIDQGVEKAGLPKDNVYSKITLLHASSYSIGFTIYMLEEFYVYAEDHMDSAKENMKNLTSEYDNYTGYSTLKSYYSELLNCFEFCELPSGTLARLEANMAKYEANCRKYRSELSIIFE